MMQSLISLYKLSYPRSLVYMLQSSEYVVKPYLIWVWRTNDFSKVMNRRTLVYTRAARLLLLALRLGILLQILIGVLFIYLGAKNSLAGGVVFGIALIISYPFVWAYLLILPLILGRYFINGPKSLREIEESKQIFANHPGIKIAVAGSYGKTTMKELLTSVLSEKLVVASTPANKNVSLSHAKFATKLKGNEDVLVIEYGEGEPGDVARFASITAPTHGVITGLAPAHLDKYHSMQEAGEDIFSLADYLKNKNVFVNTDSQSVNPFIKEDFELFNHKEALGWKISGIKVDINGTSFEMKKDSQILKLRSAVVGRHQVGYLAFASAFALRLGLSKEQVVAAISKTKPFEHRLQPYKLADAWVIDDTYNGNLEGIRAGTQLLKDLSAKRKIYITPGLVDQGVENENVHIEIGKLIADASPDSVVLMKNSVTKYIREGLKIGKYSGKLSIEADPLTFYTNLNHFVASGDLVVMQNDWPDNYI